MSRKPTNFSFLEFEHGLAPPDPWDAVKNPDDELSDLNTVFGGSARPATKTATPNSTSHTQPSHPHPRPHVTQQHSSSTPIASSSHIDPPSPPRFATHPRIPTPQPPLSSSPASNAHGGVPTPFQRAQQQASAYDPSLSNSMSNVNLTASNPPPQQHIPPPKPPKPSAMYSSSPIPGPKPANYINNGTNNSSNNSNISGSPPRPSQSPVPVSGVQVPPGLSPSMQVQSMVLVGCPVYLNAVRDIASLPTMMLCKHRNCT